MGLNRVSISLTSGWFSKIELQSRWSSKCSYGPQYQLLNAQCYAVVISKYGLLYKRHIVVNNIQSKNRPHPIYIFLQRQWSQNITTMMPVGVCSLYWIHFFFLFPHLRLMIEIELLKFYGSDCQQIPSVDADLSSSFRASLIFFFVKRMTY